MPDGGYNLFTATDMKMTPLGMVAGHGFDFAKPIINGLKIMPLRFLRFGTSPPYYGDEINLGFWSQLGISIGSSSSISSGTYPTIVVIGSSLIAPHTIPNPQYPSWTSRFEEISGYYVINKGIDGNTTAQMLERFWTDVISYHPNYCIMEVGINDWQDVSVPRTLDSTKAEVKTMLNLCLMNNIEPIFLVCLPPYNTMYGGGNYNIIDNARIQQEALKNYIIGLGYPVYPYEEALETSTGYIDLSLTFDNVHPNSQGNKLIGDKLYTYMNNLTKNDSYDYVAPETAKVVVIGDSISAGSPYSDRPINIIAIGDSGTAGAPYTNVKPSDSADTYSWTHVIRDNMPNVTIHNMAISGETSEQILARFDVDVVQYYPDYCLIGTGSNDFIGGGDVNTAVNASYTAIVTMFNECVNANIKPVFVDYLFPNYERISSFLSDPIEIQKSIDFSLGLKQRIKSHCQANGYGYIDFVPVFISGDMINGHFDNSLISYDNVHPNIDGYNKGGRVALGAMRSYIDNASWVTIFRDLTGYEVINQAVPSTTSEDSEQRFMQDVVDLKPDYCIFEHGNDVGWGMNQFYKTENAIQSVVQMCVDNDIKLIFVQPVFRYNMTAYATATSTIIEDDIDYMHKMHEFETDLGYPSLVGYYTAISNDASEVNVDMNRLADGVHPNLQGYEDVGRWLTPQILLAMSEKKHIFTLQEGYRYVYNLSKKTFTVYDENEQVVSYKKNVYTMADMCIDFTIHKSHQFEIIVDADGISEWDYLPVTTQPQDFDANEIKAVDNGVQYIYTPDRIRPYSSSDSDNPSWNIKYLTDIDFNMIGNEIINSIGYTACTEDYLTDLLRVNDTLYRTSPINTFYSEYLSWLAATKVKDDFSGKFLKLENILLPCWSLSLYPALNIVIRLYEVFNNRPVYEPWLIYGLKFIWSFYTEDPIEDFPIDVLDLSPSWD